MSTAIKAGPTPAPAYPRPRRIESDDPTDTAIPTALDLVREFEVAIAQASCPSRLLQLRERLGVCVELLQQMEAAALVRADQF